MNTKQYYSRNPDRPDTKPGNYYITGHLDTDPPDQCRPLLGPFPDNHAGALAAFDEVHAFVESKVPGIFASIGTSRADPELCNKPGTVNKYLPHLLPAAAWSRATVYHAKDTFPKDMEPLASVIHFPDARIAGLDGTAALEKIFRETNRVDGTEWITLAGIRARSTSTGDLVNLDDKWFLCEGVGWKELTEEAARWYLKTIPARDFCSTLEKTLELWAKANPSQRIPQDLTATTQS